MQNNTNIPYTYHKIEITAEDGALLRAEIKYWSKDYSIHITHPFEEHNNGCSLLLSAPVTYVINTASRDKVHHIDLLERVKVTLLETYDKKKSEFNALDVQRLIGEDYFQNNKKLFNTCCKEWNVSAVDKVILEELI